ncbi:MAG: ABC transporter substrate-binding protein, partial [Nocardioidaceae bacterium]
MRSSRVVPPAFGAEMRDESGRAPVGHPGVRVRSAHAVLRVLERLGRGYRRLLHRRHRSAVRWVVALALAVTALAAPAVVPAASAKPKVTFTEGITSDIDSLNPFLGTLAASYEAWALEYNFLVNYSMKDMSPAPALATSWDTSKDGLTWTFHMRKGVKWNDGKPLTAADVAYTYNRVLHGTIEKSNWISYLNNVKTVTAPNSNTVVMKLSSPNAVLPLLPIPIIPEHIWKHVSEAAMKSYGDEPQNGKPVVGSGPFELVSGSAGGSTFTFKRNPYYWGTKPHVDQVVFRLYKSEDPAVQALIKGELDFVEDITPLQIRSLQGRPGITAHNGVSPLFEEFAFNTGSIDTTTGKPIGNPNPAVLDPKFRYALNYAIDRNVLAKKAYQGAAAPGSSIVPSFYSTYHWQPTGSQAARFDLKKAGQLLDQAGYKKGPGGLRTLPNGKPIGTLRLYARSDYQPSIRDMDFLKEWLGDLGIKAEVQAFDSNQLSGIILKGTFDMFEWDWFVEPNPDGMLNIMTCSQRGGLSDSWFCNKQYDQLYKQQNTDMNQTSRVAKIKQMQQILYKDAPYLVIGYPKTGEAFRSDRFACFQPQPDPGGVWLQQYGGRNYTLLRPAAQAGNCSGVTSAVGASDVNGVSGSGSNTGVLVG